MDSDIELDKIIGIYLQTIITKLGSKDEEIILKLRAMCDRTNDLELNKTICKTSA